MSRIFAKAAAPDDENNQDTSPLANVRAMTGAPSEEKKQFLYLLAPFCRDFTQVRHP